MNYINLKRIIEILKETDYPYNTKVTAVQIFNGYDAYEMVYMCIGKEYKKTKNYHIMKELEWLYKYMSQNYIEYIEIKDKDYKTELNVHYKIEIYNY